MPEEEGRSESLEAADNYEKLSGWLNARVEMLANGDITDITIDVYLKNLAGVATRADKLAGSFFGSAGEHFKETWDKAVAGALSPEAMEAQALANLSAGCRGDILEIVLEKERS